MNVGRIATAWVMAIGVFAFEGAIADAANTPDPKGGSPFAITRHVIAGGGGESSGGAFVIAGTIGQPDADPLQPSTGGVFAISGGFWTGTVPAPPAGDPIFGNGFEG